jgi:hypothetical protein
MTPLERRIDRMKKTLDLASMRLAALEDCPDTFEGANLCDAIKQSQKLASEIQAVIVRNTFSAAKKGGKK